MEPKHYSRPWIARPLGEGFGPDLMWGLAVLAGAALGALVFDAWAVFAGAVIGVIVLISVRAVLRATRRR
jgi:hypothetical protein